MGNPWIGRSTRGSGTAVLGYKVIASDKELRMLVKECSSAVIAIGQLTSPLERIRMSSEMEKLGYEFPVIASNSCQISKHAIIGAGTTLGHGVIVNAGASVGKHCIINSRALVEHDVYIGDYCHISTGALTNGAVRIGCGSFVGSGAIIREGIDLPKMTVIGAGKRVMGWPLQDQ